MIIISRKAIRFFEFILKSNINAIAIFPFIFIAPHVKITKELVNHEKIHLRQEIELLIFPFYVWYLIALRRKGYYNISFEREAYANESNLNYLKSRKPFSFWKYM